MRKIILWFVIGVCLSSVTLLPVTEGRIIDIRKINERNANLQSFEEIATPFHPLLMIILWIFLITCGMAVIAPFFFLSSIPLTGYLLFFTFSMAFYMLFICPPIVFMLYILDTLFPGSTIVDIILNITFHLLLLPIMAGGALLIPFSFPVIGVAMVMVGWFILSLKISIAIFGPSFMEDHTMRKIYKYKLYPSPHL